MNTNQITNIVTTIIQALLGALVTKGIISGTEMESIGGAVAALVVFVVSHNWHSSTPPASSGGSSLGGKLPVLFSLGLSALLLSAGCSTTPQRVTYQAAGTSAITVEAALRAYDTFAAAGKTTPAQNAAVKAAYEKYQSAFAVVCDVGSVYAASATTNAPAASATLQIAVQNANQSIADLVALVQSFGVKLH